MLKICTCITMHCIYAVMLILVLVLVLVGPVLVNITAYMAEMLMIVAPP